MDRACQALARLHRSTGVVAMLFIDLDKFKAVNDNLGHERWRPLLVGVAERLAELMRDSDTVARLGGDEFVILAEDIDSADEAVALAERVIDGTRAAIPARQRGSRDARERGRVDRAHARHRPRGDAARGRRGDVSRQGIAAGGVWSCSTTSLREELSTYVQIERPAARGAPAARAAARLSADPPARGRRGRGLRGARALAPAGRATRFSGEEMLPSTFLPPAEESELIVQIGKWVLHTACAQAEAWRRSGIAIPISVNISARELTEIDLAERVREELAYCRLPGHALCLEVSEDSVQRDPERARAALKEVKRLGVSIALDKFGSGQYSLGLPSNLPLDIVKLDRGLIESFDRDKERRAMFAATIALAQARRG